MADGGGQGGSNEVRADGEDGKNGILMDGTTDGMTASGRHLTNHAVRKRGRVEMSER